MPSDVQTAWDEIEAHLLLAPGVVEKRTMNSPTLTVEGEIFAMHVEGELAFKLPAEQCSGLCAGGSARPFEIGQRLMKEWVAVEDPGPRGWVALAEDALAFVRP